MYHSMFLIFWNLFTGSRPLSGTLPQPMFWQRPNAAVIQPVLPQLSYGLGFQPTWPQQSYGSLSQPVVTQPLLSVLQPTLSESIHGCAAQAVLPQPQRPLIRKFSNSYPKCSDAHVDNVKSIYIMDV